jgi:hypothetical protein
MTTASTIQELYVAYFNRPADVAGLKFWSDILAANPGAYRDIVQDFSNSAEYLQAFRGLDSRQVVDTVYQHLFGRHAESAGVDYWAGLLDNKAVTIGNVVTEVAHGALGKDKIVIDGRVAVATAFTDHLDLKLEQLAYTGSGPNRIAADYLATIVDAQSAAVALVPANIDNEISKFAAPVVTPVVGLGVEIVGVPQGHG